HPGVLARVAGLFSRRGYNIDSIAVGRTEEPLVSRMTIVLEADKATGEQLIKQLNKLVDTVKVSDVTDDATVERELALIKVAADSSNRSEILQIISIFRAKIVDVSEKAAIIEATGDESKISALIELLRPYGIKELVRTGKIAMVRTGN
ncbi:MAG TPA: acetolactate synthase small subunit, partial [Bacillota bacterium]|nr:acetolactate synthase small subunit [Bacillota bacterium]